MVRRLRRPGRRRRLRGHVARKLALAIFAVALLMVAAGTAAGYAWLRGAFVDALAADAEMLALTAIDHRRYPTLEDLTAAGEHLARATEVAGGAFVTGIGIERARFGEPPSLTWAEARLEGTGWRLADDHRFEVFIGPEVIGVSYGLLLSVDAAGRWQALQARLAALGLIGLLAALALAGAALFVARRLVCRPLGVIAAAVEAAHAGPEAPVASLSRLAGDDEMAHLSRAVDEYLFYVSGLIESEVEPARAVIEQCPSAILVCAADGTVLAANAPALRLFGVRSLDSLPGRLGGPALLYGGRPTAFAELLAEGPAHGPGEVVLRQATMPVLVAADTMRGPDGTPIGGFVMLVDMTEMVADMRRQVGLRQEADRRLYRVQSEVARLRAELEACLVVMEHQGDARPPAHPVAVDPRVTIGAWHEEAQARGEMAPDGLVCGDLPLLRSDPGAARRIFTCALDVVRRRSRVGRPALIVTCAADEEAARITIRADGEGGGRKCSTIAEAAGDTTLLVAAIAALARAQGGQLIAERLDAAGNGLILELPREPGTEAAPADNSGRAAPAA